MARMYCATLKVFRKKMSFKYEPPLAPRPRYNGTVTEQYFGTPGLVNAQTEERSYPAA